MRFLLDQSADFRLIPHLIDQGHDVQAISRDYPAGLPDEEVLSIAHVQDRILITTDLDFGDLVIRRGMVHSGVLLMHLPGASLSSKIAALDRALSQYASEMGRLVVVTERSIRTRQTI